MIDIFNDLNIPEKELIRKESPLAEKMGKLTNTQLSLIYKNNWFHLLIPKSLGGDEMALPEFAKLMERLAAIDGSFAWNVNLGAGANMFAGFMEQKAASNIFASKKTCVAGSGSVGGTAKAQDGGFIINGHWKYASGSAHANYFSLNALLENGNEYASFLVPAAEVEILNTWNVFGMKATSSCEFKVNNIWVPSSYIFDLQKPSPTLNSTLYRFPFMLLAEINTLVMLTGIAIHFYEQIIELAKGKVLTSRNKNGSLTLFDLPVFKEAQERSKSSFLEKRETTFALLDKIWQDVNVKKEIASELSLSFSKSVSATANAARQLVDVLYPFAGMKVVFEDTEISRVYRDFKVASQHALLSPTALIW